MTHEGASSEFAEQVATVCRKRGLGHLAPWPNESAAQWAHRFRMGAVAWLETGRVPVAKDEAVALERAKREEMA